MSTFEMPASVALLLVMANLALCLGTLERRPLTTNATASAFSAAPIVGESAAVPGHPTAIGKPNAH